MLSKNEIQEIREFLNNSQNPLFFFDNDPDGLCSFVLLQKLIGRGKGFPVKSTVLDKKYLQRVSELNPDSVFILDIPSVSGEFFSEIKKINLPVVWIDHHNTEKQKIPEFVHYFNPLLEQDFPSSNTYLCYEVSGKKEDLWIVVAGSIADNFTPDIYEEFKKTYPDLAVDSPNAFDILYNSRIGEIAHILDYGLKDRTTNVLKMIKFMLKAGSPYEILEKTPENKEMHEKYQSISRKLKKCLEKAQEQANASDDFVFFEYGGDTSISAEISNGLRYLFPKKIIFVAYISDSNYANVSGRGEHVKKILDKAMKGGNFEGSTGGGHENAVGAKILKKDFEKFRDKIKEAVKFYKK